MDIMKTAQIAAQLVGVMQADFERPTAEEMGRILECARSQIRDIEIMSKMTEVPIEPSN
jgi:hypothetical protein